MRVFVLAKPHARQERIEVIDKTHLKISVTEPPEDNRANHAIIGLLARHFTVPLANIYLKSGATSRNKIFEIVI